MNIDQRIRSIIWPVTFFLFINTAAIISFVMLKLAETEGSVLTASFRIFSLALSIGVALSIYIGFRTRMSKEHESHALRMHIAHSISLYKGILIVVKDLIVGLAQAFFVFVSCNSFWVIVNFNEGIISFSNQIIFYIGYGVIILASAYVLVHRIGLAVLSIRK